MYRPLAVPAAALLALSATPSFADENSGFEFGVGLGDFSHDVDDFDRADDIDFDDLDFDSDSDARRVFAGWRFNRFVALRVDYTDFGRSRAAVNLLDFESEAEGLAPTIVGTLPVGPVELFAKGGAIFYDVEVTGTGGDVVVDESGEDLVYGAGVGVALGRVSLRGEFEVTDIDELENAESYWITAAWRF
jgi:Outer membrane protein beta-barrel domain